MTPHNVVKVQLCSQRPAVADASLQSLDFSYTKSPSSPRATGQGLLYCSGVLEPLHLAPNSVCCAPGTRFTSTVGVFVKIVRH
ncbi:Solute carrier family 25 member 39 [Plecturocebus cupreus]